MDNERYNKEIRAQKHAQRVKQVKIRLAAVCLAVLVFIIVIVSLCVSAHNRRKQAKEQAMVTEALDQSYEKYAAALADGTAAVTTSADSGEKFGAWMVKNFSKNVQDKLLAKIQDGKLKETDFYQITGNTMHVLSDQYKGYLKDTDTAAEHNIYLKDGQKKGGVDVTVAGDLCLAEDGFVLDHYDEVNDLSLCISPTLLERMNDADIFYLNHEYAISDRGAPLDGKLYTFRANPDRMSLLEEMGTDIVSLANNHVYDYGADALLDTADLLDKAGIPYVGGGRNKEEADRPIYYIVNGVKIGFVAASNAETVLYTPDAGEDTPGILSAYDTAAYDQIITDASKQCDYLIAYIHWGTEDTNNHETYQHDQGAEFLNAGADIVVGGHPHVLQGIEYVDGKPIIYSMGDFWFNDETKYTGLLKLNITDKGLAEMSFVPCLQTGYTTQYIEGADEQKAFYDFLQQLSPNAVIDDKGVITESES